MSTLSHRSDHIALGLYACSLLYLSFYAQQARFFSILIPYGIAFISYLIFIRSHRSPKLFSTILSVIVVTKVCIVFSFPGLSDDIFRFWWDGFIAINNIGPFEYTPIDLIKHLNQTNPQLAFILNEKIKLLNSQNYYSVYPMVCQWLFQLAALCSGDNLIVFTIIIKVIFLMADVLIIYFLNKILIIKNLPAEKSLIYFGNPLCIIELNTNVHFELFTILFLVIAIYFHLQSASLRSGLGFALSVSSKLLSALWIFIFIRRPFIQKSNLFFLTACFILSILLFHPVYWHFGNYQSSLRLYYAQFEFNSCLYGLIIEFLESKQLYASKKFVGVILLSIFILFYLIYVFRQIYYNRPENFFKAAWLVLFSYLILSSTVHPWYICPLLFLSVFSFRYTSMVWGGLIVLSYIRYDRNFSSYEDFTLSIEYLGVLLVFIYELYYQKK